MLSLKKTFLLLLCALFFCQAPTCSAFVQNFDRLHNAYAINGTVAIKNGDITVYFKKLFFMDGLPTAYILTAYDRNWQIPFSAGTKLTVTIDKKTFSVTATPFSRCFYDYWHKTCGQSIEFNLPQNLVAALKTAQSVHFNIASLPSFSLNGAALSDWQDIIARNHY